MAEEVKNVTEHEAPKVATEESSATAEVKDRGLFDFMGKKEEAKPEETIETEFNHKVHVSEPAPVPEMKHEEEEKKHEEEEKKPSLLEKLHRSNSSSSSSSEEEGEDGEKRKKKEKKKTEGEEKPGEEKKGFMEKIKEKLPGHGKKPEEASAAAPVTVPPAEETAEHPVEKKGILEKIKEKLPGYHSKSGEEEKKEKESD